LGGQRAGFGFLNTRYFECQVSDNRHPISGTEQIPDFLIPVIW
jgi:hypothetical protein